MSHRSLLPAALLATAALGGCSSNPPLMFGDHVSFGLQLGTDTAGSGGSVTLGYKQRSVAIVPVSVLDEQGNAQAMRGIDGQERDALSVFAVFESAAPAANERLRIGQVFSTGSAAQLLAQGYECQLAARNCASPAAPAAAGAVKTALPAAAAATVSPAAPAAAPAPSTAPAAAAGDRPYQKPLLYSRTDVAGIHIGGSAAEQGAAFSLGYASRNLALIPVYAPQGGERVIGLFGGVGGATSRDAFSVMGQFQANTSTTGLGYGLSRYFATGIAAQNLAQGLRAAVAAPSPAPPTTTPAATAATTPASAVAVAGQ
ncbi:hypothetical protein HLB44_22000 [Aquincola sp. S2]|uniref:Uncharacterized protein n=1 Tax=Pseudaquabacterium terrae TaxID=2732868 RepID=A0ABX2EM81_9BURK|nr:hypothetical protein [Aquabacterium terrae]NRF69682.1 hypothetical protein [Aquabacterium terrae]